MRRLTCRILLLACMLLAGGGAFAASHDFSLLEAQVEQARAALAQQTGSKRVLLVAAGLDDSSSAFVGDVRLADERLRAQLPQLAALKLAQSGAPSWPRATRRTLPAALQAAAQLLHEQRGDTLAVVLLSSHGNVGHIVLHTPRMRDIDLLPAATLRRWLEPLGDTPTLLIVSACHAGSLIPALHAPQRVVLAAARSDRRSFGCETESHNTYFVDELFRALRPGASLGDWFGATAQAVAEREQRLGLGPPSEPQIDVGDAWRDAARQPLRVILGTP
jgi:hypothetical protein